MKNMMMLIGDNHENKENYDNRGNTVGGIIMMVV